MQLTAVRRFLSPAKDLQHLPELHFTARASLQELSNRRVKIIFRPTVSNGDSLARLRMKHALLPPSIVGSSSSSSSSSITAAVRSPIVIISIIFNRAAAE
jgi:hypothetical protein